MVESGASAQGFEEDMAETVEQVTLSKTQAEKDKKRRTKAMIMSQHVDIVKDEFWQRRPWLISDKPGRIPKET